MGEVGKKVMADRAGMDVEMSAEHEERVLRSCVGILYLVPA